MQSARPPLFTLDGLCGGEAVGAPSVSMTMSGVFETIDSRVVLSMDSSDGFSLSSSDLTVETRRPGLEGCTGSSLSGWVFCSKFVFVFSGLSSSDALACAPGSGGVLG